MLVQVAAVFWRDVTIGLPQRELSGHSGFDAPESQGLDLILHQDRYEILVERKLTHDRLDVRLKTRHPAGVARITDTFRLHPDDWPCGRLSSNLRHVSRPVIRPRLEPGEGAGFAL